MSTFAYRNCSKCGKNAIADKTISFHRFPKPGKTNILKARAWAMYCWPEQDWSTVDSLMKLYSSCKVLCGRHFEDDCYLDSTKKRLGMFSIPGDKDYVTNLMRSLRSQEETLEQNSRTFQSQMIPAVIEQSQPIVCQDSPGPQSQPQIMPVKTQHPQPVSHTKFQEAMPGTSKSAVNIIGGEVKRNLILKKLNLRNINELSRTEKDLYTFCKKNIKELKRLRKKLKNKKVNKLDKLFESDSLKKLFNVKLNSSFALLLQSQLKNCRRPQKGRRFTIEQKIMALTLYKKSPACYHLLRRMFMLPSQSTLKTLLNKIPLKPGINPHVFNSLKNLADSQTDEENLCCLAFDEMCIKKNISYNRKLDQIDGYQDHGNHGRGPQLACNALTFMICGIRKKFKQPIAFYLSGKTLSSDRLTVLVKEILSECFNTGLNVVATVCDLSSVNVKALENLGATTGEPYFMHEGHEIVTIADPPHLLKCQRNLFLMHDIECTIDIEPNKSLVRGIAKWNHIEQFYEKDQQNPQFHFAPALTTKHINPNTKQKMRVKLAAQVFSHTVVAGILAKISTNEMSTEALATASMLKNFDNLFDALNADTPHPRRGKIFSANMTSRSPHHNLFINMKKFIREMRYVNGKTPPSQLGWLRTINAVERLWKNVSSMGIQSLSTRKLNQDPLENFFGCVRYNCGSNYNPTIQQFIAGVKTAILSNLKTTARNKNCEEDDHVLVNNMKIFLLEIPAVGDTEKENCWISEIAEEVLWEPSSPDTQACAYVCGFIIKSMKIECSQCIAVLKSSIEPMHIFTQFKEFYDKNKLNYAKETFVRAVQTTTVKVLDFKKKNGWKNNVKENIMVVLGNTKEDFDFLKGCQLHQESLFIEITKNIFYITVKKFCININREVSEEDHKKSMVRKINILKNK